MNLATLFLATLLIIAWVTVLIGICFICFIVKRFTSIEEKIDEYKKELKKIEQKPAVWSKEDEKRLDIICGLLEDIPSHQDWLRTLKDRVQLQQRAICNEEDKEKLEHIINKATYNCGLKKDDISFLKSLKQRI